MLFFFSWSNTKLFFWLTHYQVLPVAVWSDQQHGGWRHTLPVHWCSPWNSALWWEETSNWRSNAGKYICMLILLREKCVIFTSLFVALCTLISFLKWNCEKKLKRMKSYRKCDDINSCICSKMIFFMFLSDGDGQCSDTARECWHSRSTELSRQCDPPHC